MKHIIILFALGFSAISFAQDSTKTAVEIPKFTSKLEYGKSLVVDDLTFEFVAIESDSRCPKGVQCIWAGEVVALIDVFKNGKKVERKKVVFSSRSRLKNQIGNLFSSEKQTITGLSVWPYPENDKKIKLEDYCIELDITN